MSHKILEYFLRLGSRKAQGHIAAKYKGEDYDSGFPVYMCPVYYVHKNVHGCIMIVVTGEAKEKGAK